MNTDEQIIYINMDDSGVLIKGNTNDPIFVYGGIIFLSKDERDSFTRQYSSLVKNIKYKYCKDFKKDAAIIKSFCINTKKCKYTCPELKSTLISSSDKRRFLNLIKKHYCSVAIVDNNRVYDSIVKDKASKGRYKDYVIRRLVKEIIKQLISKSEINPNNPVKLILYLDEQTTKSNGYYDLRSGIIEELQYGITNFNYDTFFSPILSKVEVDIHHQDSYSSFCVQAADLIVGEIRHNRIDFLKYKNFTLYSRKTAFVDTIIYMP